MNSQPLLDFQTRSVLADARAALEKLVDIYIEPSFKEALFSVYEIEAEIERSLNSEDEHAMYLGAW